MTVQFRENVSNLSANVGTVRLALGSGPLPASVADCSSGG